MIVVTGATGKLGSGIVEQLLKRLPAEQIGVSVRDPEKARWLSEQGVRVRRGDYEDAASLSYAFEGASQVIIVSAATTGSDALRQHRTAIEAARQAGAQRALYTSHQAANSSSAVVFARDHAATETMLQESRMSFTSLRNGFYVSSALQMLGQAVSTGVLSAPSDGPVSWTAHADLAEAAAIALTEEGRLDGLPPPLTGSEALDLAAVAQIAADITGRPIKRVVVSDDEYRTVLLSHGLPEPRADMFLGFFAASRRGEFAVVDPLLGQLLGRPPTLVREAMSAALTG